MGVEFGSEAHEAAIAKILASAKKAGKIAAIFCASAISFYSYPLVPSQLHPSARYDADADALTGLTGEQAAKRFAQGFDMVSVTTDIDTITDGFAAALNTATDSSVEGVKGYNTK